MTHLPPKYITIHAAATYPSMDIDAQQVRVWHTRDKGWSDIGYHFFIQRDGTVEKGRPIYRVGAHVGGHNTGNVGVCMAGGLREGSREPEDNFSDAQYTSLTKLLTELHWQYESAEIVGHNFFAPTRGCPCFDWRKYVEYLQEAWAVFDYLDADWYDQSKYHWKDEFNEDLTEVNLYKEMPQIHTNRTDK